MVNVIFTDLSVTIDTKIMEVDDSTMFYEAVNLFADSWRVEDVTISGKPIPSDGLYKHIALLAKDGVLVIEKHK